MATPRFPRLARIHAHLQFVLDRDHAASSARSGELAYLANTIMAGCSIQARPFTAQEASDAAVAICNLGLENWPRHWRPKKTHESGSIVAGEVVLPDALDVMAIFDMPAWATLLGLIDECPTAHAGLRASQDPRTRAVNASSFEFISENGQIAAVRDFMRALLPTIMRGV